MLLHSSHTRATQQPTVVISTHTDRWVLPCDCELIKLLLRQQAIRASDLCFETPQQCQRFIKKLLLLALEDECRSHKPSSLARFARSMIATNQTQLVTNNDHTKHSQSPNRN